MEQDGQDQNNAGGPGGGLPTASGEGAGGGGGAAPATPFAPVETPDLAEEDHDNPLVEGMDQGEALGPIPATEGDQEPSAGPLVGPQEGYTPEDASPAVAAGEGVPGGPAGMTPYHLEGVTPAPEVTPAIEVGVTTIPTTAGPAGPPAIQPPRVAGAPRRLGIQGPARRVRTVVAPGTERVFRVPRAETPEEFPNLIDNLVQMGILEQVALAPPVEHGSQHDEPAPPSTEDDKSKDVFMPTSNGAHHDGAPTEVTPNGGAQANPQVNARGGPARPTAGKKKKLSEMKLRDFVLSFKRGAQEGDRLKLDTYSDIHRFYGGFRATWTCDVGVGREGHKDRHEAGRALVDYVQEFIEYMDLLNCPWDQLGDRDLEQVFSRGLRGSAKRRWQDVTRQAPLLGSQRTFEANFNDFCAGHLLEIKDEGWWATTRLLTAKQEAFRGETAGQYWARLGMSHARAARESVHFKPWDESKMMAHWETTLEPSLSNLLLNLRDLGGALPDAQADPADYRRWVDAQERIHFRGRLTSGRIGNQDRRQRVQVNAPGGKAPMGHKPFGRNGQPKGRHPGSNPRRNNGSPPRAPGAAPPGPRPMGAPPGLQAHVNAVTPDHAGPTKGGSQAGRADRVKKFQARWGVYPKEPRLPQSAREGRERVKMAQQLGICLGCHQEGHIAKDPNCPAKGAAAWDAGKFRAARTNAAQEYAAMAMLASELEYEREPVEVAKQ